MHYANIMFLSYSLPLLPDATFCMTFSEAFGAMFCATLDMTFSITFNAMSGVTFGAMFGTAFCAMFGSTFWQYTRYALQKSEFMTSHYSKISAHYHFLQHFHKIKFAVTVKNRIFAIPIRNGALAERLGTGLQNLLQRFDSARHLSTSLSVFLRGIFLIIAISQDIAICMSTFLKAVLCQGLQDANGKRLKYRADFKRNCIPKRFGKNCGRFLNRF